MVASKGCLLSRICQFFALHGMVTLVEHSGMKPGDLD